MSNSPFSRVEPKLQIAWDATSLRSLMACPRQYQYSIIEGWRSKQESVDVHFGRYFASATEVFKKARLNGSSKAQATLETARYIIEETWPVGSGPWGGSYEELWRCTGTTPFKNAKGHRAKCPYSHKGVWLPGAAPSICGSCGSAIDTGRQWVPDNKAKNRVTLVSLVLAYCDAQAEHAEDGPVPYAFPDGTAAVELSFRMPLPWVVGGDGLHNNGERYLLTGHLDSILKFGKEHFISDNKTTRHSLNQQYFAQYAPNIQMDTYDLAGATLFGALEIKGVLIEGAQTLATGTKFGIGIVYGSDERREEYLKDLRYWLDQAERFARDNYWPMNRASCYLCPFKSVCSKDESVRQMYLEADFEKRHWNPLEER